MFAFACEDIDAVELYAGQAAVSNALSASGYTTARIDISYSPTMDANGRAGLAWLAEAAW